MKPTDDHSLKILAARYIRRQVRQLTEQIEGIRAAEDIEFVHRARVASRRLRTALAVFADLFGLQRVKAWRKAVRRTARDLGDARDKDVQIEYVRAMLVENRNPAAVAGIARTMVRWERQRASLQPAVLRSLRRLLSSRVLHEILAACKAIRPKDDGEVDAVGPGVFAHAQQNILARFDELWSLRGCLADPQDYQRHHAMRIAAKRLRYTIEIYRGPYGQRLEGVLDVMKQIQSYLGDLHDCDVWIAELGKVLEKEARRIEARYGHPGPMVRIEPGIRFLQEERCSRRRKVFDALVQYWTGLTEQAFWDDLAEVVSPPREVGFQPAGGAGSDPAAGDGRAGARSAREGTCEAAAD